MDRIAKAGLRYTNFHSTSFCSPTRAALITGRNHHSVGFGVVGEIATGFPATTSSSRSRKARSAPILKANGYATSWFGKDHNTPSYQSSQAGPFDQWPNGMGFEYFYGFVGGDASQWQPNLFRNTTAIYPFLGNPGWNLETAMADEAIQYIKQLKEVAPDKPWLRLLRAGRHPCAASSHAGVDQEDQRHAPVRRGLEQAAREIFANQKRLGIMPENAQLTPWPKELPEWDSLSWDEKKLFIKQADVYGAYLAYADHEIGRVIQAVEDIGELDNTLIIYIGGDNGASAEGMFNGTPNEFTTFNGVAVPVKDQFLWYPFWGSERTFPHFAAGWAWAMGTPFKWVKQVPSHFGGTAQGVAMSWPGHITDAGAFAASSTMSSTSCRPFSRRPALRSPTRSTASSRCPIEGVSMAYTWDKTNANAPTTPHDAIFRDARQSRHLSGRLGGGHDACDAAMGAEHRTPPDVITGYNWELYNVMETLPSPRISPRRCRTSSSRCRTLLFRSEEIQRVAARQFDARPLECAAPELSLRGERSLPIPAN